MLPWKYGLLFLCLTEESRRFPSTTSSHNTYQKKTENSTSLKKCIHGICADPTTDFGSYKSAIIQNRNTKSWEHETEYMPHMNLLQSTIWPEALVYIQFNHRHMILNSQIIYTWHICPWLHVRLSGTYVSISTSQEFDAINSVTMTNTIHVFHITSICSWKYMAPTCLVCPKALTL